MPHFLCSEATSGIRFPETAPDRRLAMLHSLGIRNLLIIREPDIAYSNTSG